MSRHRADRHVARLGGWVTACVLLPVFLASRHGPAWAGLGILASAALTVALIYWLPRSAHGAFAAGTYVKAARRYRVLERLAFSAPRERAAHLSRAACAIAQGRADASLDAFAPDGTDERVVWLNNTACARLAVDPADALRLADEAVGLRPDLPAVQHTRALALIAVGRTDAAIAVLDAMRRGGELVPALEAQRCEGLARAWEAKGQADYADDYRARARLVAR